MEICKNSRQIPRSPEICGSKKYLDILYAYLQQVSQVENKMNLVYKEDVNFTKIGKMLGFTRQTIAKKFNNLKELGLIVESDEYPNHYILTKLERDIASLIPYPTLKLLVDALSEHAISTYVYLFNLYYANKCEPIKFCYAQIKKFLGICDTTRSNDETISNILLVLQKIGLIKIHLITEVTEDGRFGNVKTMYQLDQLVNVIKEQC